MKPRTIIILIAVLAVVGAAVTWYFVTADARAEAARRENLREQGAGIGETLGGLFGFQTVGGGIGRAVGDLLGNFVT